MKNLYNLIKDYIPQISKALGGAIATSLVAFLTVNGVILDPEFSNALSVVATGVIGFAAVWLAPKNK